VQGRDATASASGALDEVGKQPGHLLTVALPYISGIQTEEDAVQEGPDGSHQPVLRTVARRL
jgi:hypothetical protein